MATLCGLIRFQDEDHRKNFILTLLIAFDVFNIGSFYGLLGPSLPDLQRLTGTNLQEVSLLLTIQAVGRAVGGVLLGYLYDRTQRFLLLLTLLACGAAVSIAALPWTQVYGVFLAVSSVCGFCLAGTMIGSNAKVLSMWRTESRQYTQFVHFSFALGGVVSPLTASPFFAKSHTAPSNITTSGNNTHPMTFDAQKQAKGINKIISDTGIYDTRAVQKSVNVSNVTTLLPSLTYGESEIFVPFAITGGLFLLSFLCFLLFGCVYRRNEVSSVAKKEPGKNDTKEVQTRTMSKSLKVVLFISFVLLKVVASSTEFVQHAYLMTFAIRQLQWTRVTGALLTSLLWAAFGFGRFLGIFIARCLTPTQMTYFSLFSVLLTSGGQFAAGYFKVGTLTWIFVPLSGLAISVLSPSLLVWVNENLVKVSGKVSSLFSFTNSLAMITSPLYVAFLIDKITPMWYVYVQGLQSSTAILFFSILVVGARYRTDPERQPLLGDTSIQS